MPSRRIDWVSLEAEYVISSMERFPTKTAFFNFHKIPHSTWAKRKETVSWDAKRTAYLQKAAEEAVRRGQKKRVEFLEKTQKLGQALQKVALESPTDQKPDGSREIKPSMAITSAADAARVMKIGVEIEAKVVELEVPDSITPQGVPIDGGGVTFNESECIAELESKLARLIPDKSRTS